MTGADLTGADLGGANLVGKPHVWPSEPRDTQVSVKQLVSARITPYTKLPPTLAKDPAVQARIAELASKKGAETAPLDGGNVGVAGECAIFGDLSQATS
ncbi:hypothetical protein ACFYO0_17265 [Streptomyces sp. NPDC006365]|uniref:hypothetical protein n=1 Tax=Streptomyces sp. NPDC006365 TaxID=3364744 RepID=UPI0036845105